MQSFSALFDMKLCFHCNKMHAVKKKRIHKYTLQILKNLRALCEWKFWVMVCATTYIYLFSKYVGIFNDLLLHMPCHYQWYT